MPTYRDTLHVDPECTEWLHEGGLSTVQGLLGCRIGGVANLKLRDVDLDRGFVTIRNKGKVRTVPLTPEATEILERWVRPDPSGTGRVFHAASVSTIRQGAVAVVHGRRQGNPAGGV